MTVAELIAHLEMMPQCMDVRIEGPVCAMHVDTVDEVFEDPTPGRTASPQKYVVIYPGDFKPI